MDNQHDESTAGDSSIGSSDHKEIHENEGHTHEQHYEDRFTEFMFGPQRQKRPNPRETMPHQQHYPQNGLYIDYERLFNSLDTLWESSRNLKPLFSRFMPFLQKFWKKT
jgi:hypothetical protein